MPSSSVINFSTRLPQNDQTISAPLIGFPDSSVRTDLKLYLSRISKTRLVLGGSCLNTVTSPVLFTKLQNPFFDVSNTPLIKTSLKIEFLISAPPDHLDKSMVTMESAVIFSKIQLLKVNLEAIKALIHVLS